jgi:hypothetical protein
MHLDLHLADGRQAHLRLDDALNISLSAGVVYTLDLSGRLIGAFRDGRNLRRGLDGRVLARWRQSGGPRQHLWLDDDEAGVLLAGLRTDLDRLVAVDLPPEFAQVVGRGLGFDYAADVARFGAIYRPVAILPPDQYQALVLQATEGCSFNSCTFCALYRSLRFRIKTEDEFAHHIAAVRDFFGPGLLLRRSIFLADANALIMPQPRLLSLLAVIHHAFAIMPDDLPPGRRRPWLAAHPTGISGLYAFIDGLSAEHKSVDDFRVLRQLGLRRVYIGLESGHEPLLAWLRKPSPAAAMLDAVRRIKTAGVQVGVIVLTGVGGRRFDRGHIADTAAILDAMALAAGDLIYFSPFQPDPDAPYLALAAADGVGAPDPALALAQEKAIRAALTLPPSGPDLGGPQRAPYNLRDFVY